MAEKHAQSAPIPPTALADALRDGNPAQLEHALLEWVYQDRELAQAQALLDQRALSSQQAALLYYWLYMIELVIAGNHREGRRWLDQNSQFRLHLAGILLRLTRTHGDVCQQVYSWRSQPPLRLTPHRVEAMIRERECQRQRGPTAEQRAA